MEEHKERTNVQSQDNSQSEREEKTFIQIQTLSLGTKPLTICMKQIVQREWKESWKSTKPRRGLHKKKKQKHISSHTLFFLHY